MNILFTIKLLLGMKGWASGFLMGFNTGTSNSSSGSKNFPQWAQGLMRSLAPLGTQAEAQYKPAGGPLTTAANSTLMNEVTGANLNPANNPTEQEVNAQAQQQGQQQFASDVDQIEGAANATGAYGNSGVPAAEADAAQRLSTGIAGITNANDQNWVNQQVNLQAQAVPQAQQVNVSNLNALLAIQNAIRGLTSQQSTDSFSFSGGL